MELPKDQNITETELFWIWLNEDGALCTKYKKNINVTHTALKDTYDVIHKMIGNKKVCNLVDISNRTDSNKEIRDYALEENSKFVIAQAIISDSKLTKFIADLFITLKKTPFPIQMFTNERDAKEWLKKYL